MSRPTHGYCPACEEDSAVDFAGDCLWCGGPTEQRRARSAAQGFQAKLSHKHLRALHRLHLERGLSIRELGRRIWKQAGFSSAASAAGSIEYGFVRLGLKRRTQAEAAARSNEARRLPGSPGTEDMRAYKRWQRSRQGAEPTREAVA